MRVEFQRSDTILGTASATLDFDASEGRWVQLTYDTLRTQDGGVIAWYDHEEDVWLANDATEEAKLDRFRGPWSDIVVSFI